MDTWSYDTAWQLKCNGSDQRQCDNGTRWAVVSLMSKCSGFFCPSIWMDPYGTANCVTVLASVTVLLQDRHEEGVILTRLWVGHTSWHMYIVGWRAGGPLPTPRGTSHCLPHSGRRQCYNKERCTHYCNCPCAIFQQVIAVAFESLGIRYIAHGFRSVRKYLLLHGFNFLSSKPQMYLRLMSLFLLNQY